VAAVHRGSAGKDQFDLSTKAGLTAVAPNATVVQTVIAKDRAQSQTDISNALRGHTLVKLWANPSLSRRFRPGPEGGRRY
jgi:hypothetical protein